MKFDFHLVRKGMYMDLFEITEYEWHGYYKVEYLRHTGKIYSDQDKAQLEADRLNYPYTYRRFRVEVVKLIT